MLQMDGQVAMVTGAANGIGRAIVERFVAEGMNVVSVDISAADLTEATASYGDQVYPAVADISDRSQVQAAVHAALFRFGQLDVLAANAICGPGHHRDLTIHLQHETTPLFGTKSSPISDVRQEPTEQSTY